MAEGKTVQAENSSVGCNSNHVETCTDDVSPIMKVLHEVVVRMASTNFGQFFIKKLDKILWTVENTAKWSVPQNIHESESDKSIPPPPLVRPLPWLLFIPALIAMRLFRAVLTFTLVILGQESVTPSSVVHFLQVRRRKLRAIKYQGLKAHRTKHNESKSKQNQSMLSRLFSLPVALLCARGTVIEPERIVVGNKSKSETGKKEETPKKRPHGDDDDDDESEEERDENLTSHDLLNKYCNIDSEDDPNYEVGDESESEEESSDEESNTEDAIEHNNEKKQNGDYKGDSESKEHANGVAEEHPMESKTERNNIERKQSPVPDHNNDQYSTSNSIKEQNHIKEQQHNNNQNENDSQNLNVSSEY